MENFPPKTEGKTSSTSTFSMFRVTGLPPSSREGSYFPLSSFYHWCTCRTFSSCPWHLWPVLILWRLYLSWLNPGSLDNFSVFLLGYQSLLVPSVGFLFLLEFVQELLVHPCRPPGVSAWPFLCWDALLLHLEEVVLEYWLTFLDTCSLQGFVPWYSTKQIPWRCQKSALEIQCSELAVHPLCYG